jgi:hypothetical protein
MADPNVPPPPMKLTIFINHNPTNTGWSETYYLNAATPASALTTAALFVPTRMGCLSNKYSLVYGRVSDMSKKGDGYPLFAILPQLGTFVPATGDGAQPGSALVTRWTDGTGTHTMRVVHGVPEESVTDGILTPAAPWTTAINNYFASIVSNCLMRKKIAIAPFVSFVALNAITVRYMTVKRVGRPFGLLRGRAALRT